MHNKPDYNAQRERAGSNVKSEKIHTMFVLVLLSMKMAAVRKNVVMARPIVMVCQGTEPIISPLGTNTPTTKEAKRIFAPSRKKFERMFIKFQP